MKNLEQYEKMHREVETLGNAGNYHGQAQAFIAGTGCTLEARFAGMKAGHFDPTDTSRDIWDIRLSRNGRVYTFQYGNSVAGTEKRIERLLGYARDTTGAGVRKGYIELSPMSQLKLKRWEKAAVQWVQLDTVEAMTVGAPKPYDIFTCLTTHEPPEEVDEFAAEFGITKISEAVRTHKAVLKEWQNLRALFDNDELETLGLIS